MVPYKPRSTNHQGVQHHGVQHQVRHAYSAQHLPQRGCITHKLFCYGLLQVQFPPHERVRGVLGHSEHITHLSRHALLSVWFSTGRTSEPVAVNLPELHAASQEGRLETLL
jgi:hypothetical protein